jgi:3-phosphoshikimate 1-carboxyvinyltransferase
MSAVHDLIVEPQRKPLVGSVPVPADDAIATLALLVGAMAEGTSEVRRLSFGPDAAAMIGALRALGVSVETGSKKGTASLKGVGLAGFSAPHAPVGCAGSARAMRLLAGALVSCPFETVLDGDAALLGTSMVKVLDALRRRGAVIEGAFSAARHGEVTPPLVVGPLGSHRRLSGTEHEIASPAAEVKEALLLSGLSAEGATFVRERIASPDHAERMLAALGVPVAVAGPIVRLDVEAWSGKLPSFTEDVPGDASASALLLAAASLGPGSRVCARGTGLNVMRRGALDWLRHMGGTVEIEVHGTTLGEPEGVACASYAELRGATMAGENLLRASGELGVLVALAARARGATEIGDLGALVGLNVGAGTTAKLVSTLRSFGVDVETRADGLSIEGKPDGPLQSADIDCEDDASTAAAAALLGLVADGPTRIRRVDALARRFPRFAGTLRALGAEARVE